MARKLCCRGMCKNLLRSDGQQRNYSKAKFPSNLNCGHKIVSETAPWSVTLARSSSTNIPLSCVLLYIIWYSFLTHYLQGAEILPMGVIRKVVIGKLHPVNVVCNSFQKGFHKSKNICHGTGNKFYFLYYFFILLLFMEYPCESW